MRRFEVGILVGGDAEEESVIDYLEFADDELEEEIESACGVRIEEIMYERVSHWWHEVDERGEPIDG